MVNPLQSADIYLISSIIAVQLINLSVPYDYFGHLIMINGVPAENCASHLYAFP